MNILFVLLIICITLFSLLGFYLLITRRGRRLVNSLLAVFFLLWAIDFLDGYLHLDGFFLEHVHLALWTDPLILLYGPLIYLYTRNYLAENPELKVSDLKHVIPFLLAFSILLFGYQLRPAMEKSEILNSMVNMEQPQEVLYVFIVVYLHFFLYLYYSVRLVRARERQMLQYFSQKQLQGLTRLLRAIMLLLVVSLLNSFLQFYSERALFETGTAVLLLLVGLFIASLLLKALDQSSSILPAGIAGRYGGSTLPSGEMQAIGARIARAMEEKQLYLNPELTIDELASAVGSTSRMVSQTINSGFGKNFFDYVNTYRIAMAQRLFQENTDPKLTVLEVMYQAGFNSKSSFNTQFRIRTGTTPSAYLRQTKKTPGTKG